MNWKDSLIAASVAVFWLSAFPSAQVGGGGTSEPDQTWVGQRIVMLRGWGAVYVGGETRAKTAVGINIVSPISRVEGSRLWIASTGGDTTGWIEARDVVLLSDALTDETVHNPQRAIAAAQRAVALDRSRPTLLTILAAAHATAGDFTEAVKHQRLALASRQFPPSYRSDAENQLHTYEEHLQRQR
jgi:hypothetical protein